MNDQPALLLLMSAAGLYVFHLWRQDYLANQQGRPNRGALPGATPASIKACLIASAGALLILTLETWGEIELGLSNEQSTMTILFGCYSLIAAFIEELIFRGFIIVEGRGKFLRWTGVWGASILFALLHPFLWRWENSSLELTFTAKGCFSTGAVFVSSLWFYVVRLAAFNPTRSLLPCIAAHASKNLGVFAIKALHGFIAGWW